MTAMSDNTNPEAMGVVLVTIETINRQLAHLRELTRDVYDKKVGVFSITDRPFKRPVDNLRTGKIMRMTMGAL